MAASMLQLDKDESRLELKKTPRRASNDDLRAPKEKSDDLPWKVQWRRAAKKAVAIKAMAAGQSVVHDDHDDAAKAKAVAELLREAAALGFGGIFVDPEHGGTGLQRLDGVVIFEALARGCTATTSYLTIHNMCGWMIDTFGNDEQKQAWLPDLIQGRS